MSNRPLEEIEEPSGVLADSPPINWQAFGQHAEAMKQAFGTDPVFNSWLMCSIGSEEDFDKLLEEIKNSGDAVNLIRAKLAQVLKTE